MDDVPLSLLPNLRMTTLPNGRVMVTQKFVDGVLEYVRRWPGSVTVYAEVEAAPTDNLDNIAMKPNELPFGLRLVDYRDLLSAPGFAESAIALASAGHRQNHVARLCSALGLPCVYVTETSLRTRHQIIDAETSNPLLRLRRRLWASRQEKVQAAAIAAAAGVQCNGMPTYEAYRQINSNALLYFDTRMSQSLLATQPEVEARLEHCLAAKPLRLLFSGRLTAIKGVDHLIAIALRLRAMAVNFVLTICGQGDLLPSMRAVCAEHGLEPHVRFTGVLDFGSELIPLVKRETDIFVCCHRQGDPSCTYLETMSCGVPIVGYDNEAFAGLVTKSGVGWQVKMNHPEAMAEEIARLDRNRMEIALASRGALHFASQHTFDREFERRAQHLLRLARNAKH